MIVDKAKEVSAEVIKGKFQEKLAEAATAIVSQGASVARRIAEWLVEKLGEAGGASKDMALDGLKSLLTSLCASLIAKLLHWLGANPMAQEIGSGDFAAIIDESAKLRGELDDALADLPG